jgi:hypothetical protein
MVDYPSGGGGAGVLARSPARAARSSAAKVSWRSWITLAALVAVLIERARVVIEPVERVAGPGCGPRDPNSVVGNSRPSPAEAR